MSDRAETGEGPRLGIHGEFYCIAHAARVKDCMAGLHVVPSNDKDPQRNHVDPLVLVVDPLMTLLQDQIRRLIVPPKQPDYVPPVVCQDRYSSCRLG